MLGARRTWIVAAAVAALAAAAVPAANAGVHRAALSPADWRTYGGSAQHDFTNATGLNKLNVHTLAPKWFFKTGDAVTANPVIVNGVVYVGSWDGNFYAIDAATGAKRWSYAIKAQPAVTPREDANGRVLDPTDPESYATSDGGLITSAAWYQPASTETGNRD